MMGSHPVWRVFTLSCRQQLRSRRSAFLALLVGAPVLMSIAIRLATASLGPFRMSGAGAAVAVFGTMISLLYVRFIVPVVGVFAGTALIADEVDDKTITYLFTRPIPRQAVLLGKYLAYLASAGLLVLPSAALSFLFLVPLGDAPAALPALAGDLAMLAAGLVAYGAVFAFVGARLHRPLTIGLVFAFGWEPLVQWLPGYLNRLTVVYYLLALRDTPAFWTAAVQLASIASVMLWLAARTVEQREYVLEQ